MRKPVESAARPVRRGGVVVPQRATWRYRVAARAVWAAIRVMSLTVRYRVVDDLGLLERGHGGRFIFAVWHNRLVLCLALYERLVRSREPGRRMAAMVSASRDGGFLTRILELFRVEPVRGSTSRRGPQALRELVSWGERGCDLAITPDGPRGPRYVVQEGVVAVAQLTGLPILAASYRLHWKLELKSWDRLQIPLPFTRCDVRFAEPLVLPRELGEAEREAWRERLENVLRSITVD